MGQQHRDSLSQPALPLRVGLRPCLLHCLTQCQLDCRQGRKPLFLVCGSIMAAMQIATGILTAVTFTGVKIPATAGIIMIVFICIFVSQFAASWGPLGWLVPSEMHPLQTRTAGQVRSPSMPWICVPDAMPCVLRRLQWMLSLPCLAVSDPSALSTLMTQLRLHFAVQGINVFFNFLASFIIGQFFNTMLCSMQVLLKQLDS